MLARLVAAKSGSDARISRDLRDIGSFAARLDRAQLRIRQGATEKLKSLDSLLESYSYKGVLERGFVLVRDAAGTPVLSASALAPGDGISLSFRDDGEVGATVDTVGVDGTPPKTPPKKSTTRKPKPARKSDAGDDPQGSLL